MKNFPKKLKHDMGVMMTLEESRIIIEFKTNISDQFIKKFLKENRLEFEEPEQKENLLWHSINHTETLKWLRTINGEKLPPNFVRDLYKKYKNEIQWIGPVYRIAEVDGQGGLLTPLPHVLLIKPVENLRNEDEKTLIRELEKLRLKEIVSKSQYIEPYRYFILEDPARANVYELREKIEFEVDSVQEASFENIPMLAPDAVIPNDTFFNRQWNMRQIRAGGPGMTGWDITTGSNAVTIAIIDRGCDLAHPDLSFINNGFNANTGTLNGSFNPAEGNSGHGTCCAGIAAAIFNSNSGVAGVAGSCRILPVKVTPWSDVNVAAGIRWAANSGADVLSMSFGVYAVGNGSGPVGWNFAIIDPQINYAFNTRSCVLVAASGNENLGTFNRYPARHPQVIAVGASDQADNRKSPASADGECWGSNFGLQTYNGIQTGVSVVAPGVQISTTDNQAGQGYNTNGGPIRVACVNYPNSGDTGGNYFFLFNGTSAATPHVAGLAALILSLNSYLRPQQVRNIIERTAAKVGPLPYSINPSFPNGTWNQQMGYGRIDVLGALQAVPKAIFKEKEFKEGKEKEKEFKEKEKEFFKGEFKDSYKEYLKEKDGFKESPKEFKDKDFKDIREFNKAFDAKLQESKFVDGFHPTMPNDFRQLSLDLASIRQRLELIEQFIGIGQAFISQSERPKVGETLAKSVYKEQER